MLFLAFFFSDLQSKIYMIFILILLVPLFRHSLFRVVVFFCIPIYHGYYALPYHDFKANIQEEKAIFKIAKKSNILIGK